MIIDNRDSWPHPAIANARQGGTAWVEISAEHADYSLNVLPPIYIPGGFMVSEPADHTPEGDPIYTAIIQIGSRYFARDVPWHHRKDARKMLLAELASD